MIGGWTHNEPTAIIIDILLQGCLTQTSGKARVRNLRTNLIVQHGFADVPDYAVKFFLIAVVTESRGLAYMHL